MRKSLKSRAATAAAACLTAIGLSASQPAHAQQGFCLGQVMVFGGNFCPRSWAPANGQLLAISSNEALFSIFGTIYGGDGRTTFGLPDLRARAAIHLGEGPGLNNYNQGSRQGSQNFTLSIQTIPSHNHTMNASSSAGNSRNPAGNVLARSTAPSYFSGSASSRPAMNSTMIANSGGGIPVTKVSPYQVIMYCVNTQGIYCSRN